MTTKVFSALNALGALFSTLCAVHCLAMPLVLAFLPALGLSLLMEEKWERGLCLTVMVLAGACLWNGCRRHRQWRVLLWLAGGGPLLIFVQWGFRDELVRAPGHEFIEAGIMFVGGLALAIGHWHNHRLNRTCRMACCARPSAPTVRSSTQKCTP